MTTIIFTLLVLFLLVVPIALWALFLVLGLRWAHVKDVTIRRILWAALFVFVAQFIVRLVALFVMTRVGSLELLVTAVGLGLQIVIPFVVIMKVFQTSFVCALRAWLPTLLAPLIMLGVILVVIRPHIFEANKTPTNSMAPTLLGRHWKAACTECGSPAYCSPLPRGYASTAAWPMICGEHFHITRPAAYEEEVNSPDRFLVAKFLEPQRWDIVVFQFPEDPSVQYVMRLVGLPNEKITIENGQVFVDGELLRVPDSIRGIQYIDQDEWPRPMWGTSDRPAELTGDEYFVLGDFSPQAKDSRRWEVGANGHHPYAVPRSHLKGVVTHTYWPPSRWRSFR